MDPVVVSVISSTVTFLITGLLGFGGRLMFRGMRDWMEKEIKSHLVPNGGSSLADKLNRIEENVDSLMELHKDGHPYVPVRGSERL